MEMLAGSDSLLKGIFTILEQPDAKCKGFTSVPELYSNHDQLFSTKYYPNVDSDPPIKVEVGVFHDPTALAIQRDLQSSESPLRHYKDSAFTSARPSLLPSSVNRLSRSGSRDSDRTRSLPPLSSHSRHVGRTTRRRPTICLRPPRRRRIHRRCRVPRVHPSISRLRLVRWHPHYSTRHLMGSHSHYHRVRIVRRSRICRTRR
jgi:hypothetical protein